MITIRPSTTAPIAMDMLMNSPSVYLDNCAISDFADNPTLGNQFRSILQSKNGTLCVSTLNLVEANGLCPGLAYSRMKSFLSTFGNGFVILDFDPNEVTERERRWKPNDTCPAFDIEMMKEVIREWDGLSAISLGILLEVLEKNPAMSQKLKDFHREFKKKTHEWLRTVRQTYNTNQKVKENVASLVSPDPLKAGPTEYLHSELRRVCIKQDLTPNDTTDLFHSIVSNSYCDFVVLDKKWASRVRKIKLPQKSAKVFGANEYPSFMQALAA